jgi:hypothetical protein
MSYLRIATRQRSIAILALAAALTSPAHAVQPASSNEDILGKWRITKVLDASNITALDDKEAAQLVGKLFIVEADKVSLAGEVCTDPEFDRHYEDTVRYLREEAHASSWKLGLPSTVAVVDLSCTEALIKGYNKIVLLWKGIFFDAVKQDLGMPRVPARQAKR